MLRQNFHPKNETRISTDHKYINLNEYFEVEYWCKKFDVAPELLKSAVKESGSTVAAEVETYIRNKYPNK